MIFSETKNTIKILKLMAEDLNDMHNNYDISTETENNYRQEIIDAINNFNTQQNTWKVTLKHSKKGWYIKYE